MQTVVSQPFEATLPAPEALEGLGARAEVPVTRAIVAAWQAASYDPADGLWHVTLDAPVAAGAYLLVWRTSDAEPPAYEIFLPLTVLAALPEAPPNPDDWRPTVEQVAAVTPAYTRGGFDDDFPQAGAERGVYDDNTSPTAAEVEDLIDAAQAEVQGRVGTTIPARCFELARITATWHVAASIAAGKLPAGTDDASGEYRAFIANYRNSLDALVEQARATGTRLV